jgi:hydrogenase/urease accessory protein HupE
MDEDSTKISYLLAFIIIGLMIYGFYRAVKEKQMVVWFLVFFSSSVALGTFVVLQARWDQPRFILVHMPAILLGIFYGIYKFFEKNSV